MDQNEEFRARFEAEMREQRSREDATALAAERKEQEYQAFRAAELARLKAKEAAAAKPVPPPPPSTWLPDSSESDHVVWDKPQSTSDSGWTVGSFFGAIFFVGLIAAFIYLFVRFIGMDIWHWLVDNSDDCAPNCNTGPRYFFFWRR